MCCSEFSSFKKKQKKKLCLLFPVWKPQSNICIREHLVNEKLKYLYLVPQREENILLKCLDNSCTGNFFHCFRNPFVYNNFRAK